MQWILLYKKVSFPLVDHGLVRRCSTFKQVSKLDFSDKKWTVFCKRASSQRLSQNSLVSSLPVGKKDFNFVMYVQFHSKWTIRCITYVCTGWKTEFCRLCFSLIAMVCFKILSWFFAEKGGNFKKESLSTTLSRSYFVFTLVQHISLS